MAASAEQIEAMEHDLSLQIESIGELAAGLGDLLFTGKQTGIPLLLNDDQRLALLQSAVTMQQTIVLTELLKQLAGIRRELSPLTEVAALLDAAIDMDGGHVNVQRVP